MGVCGDEHQVERTPSFGSSRCEARREFGITIRERVRPTTRLWHGGGDVVHLFHNCHHKPNSICSKWLLEWMSIIRRTQKWQDKICLCEVRVNMVADLIALFRHLVSKRTNSLSLYSLFFDGKSQQLLLTSWKPCLSCSLASWYVLIAPQ